jgi:hypothetical protein
MPLIKGEGSIPSAYELVGSPSGEHAVVEESNKLYA